MEQKDPLQFCEHWVGLYVNLVRLLSTIFYRRVDNRKERSLRNDQAANLQNDVKTTHHIMPGIAESVGDAAEERAVRMAKLGVVDENLVGF